MFASFIRTEKKIPINIVDAYNSCCVRGGIKTVFFTFGQKEGGFRPIQKILIRKYSDFFDQRGLYQIFWHSLPKNGGFIIKKNCPFFFYYFSPKRGRGVWAESKKSLSEKTEVVKKGGEGGLSFLLKVKKQFFSLISTKNKHLQKD